MIANSTPHINFAVCFRPWLTANGVDRYTPIMEVTIRRGCRAVSTEVDGRFASSCSTSHPRKGKEEYLYSVIYTMHSL